jgi:hypothetical protein
MSHIWQIGEIVEQKCESGQSIVGTVISFDCDKNILCMRLCKNGEIKQLELDETTVELVSHGVPEIEELIETCNDSISSLTSTIWHYFDVDISQSRDDIGLNDFYKEVSQFKHLLNLYSHRYKDDKLQHTLSLQRLISQLNKRINNFVVDATNDLESKLFK